MALVSVPVAVFAQETVYVVESYHAKTLGGLVLYGKDMAILAGELVKKILEEEKRPAELRPDFDDRGVFLFSKAQLAKWKISLPEKILQSAP